MESLKPYLYPISLAVISLVVLIAERAFPWKPAQKALRPRLWSDVFHLVFNSHFLGVILYGIAVYRVIPILDAQWVQWGVKDLLYRGLASDWPIWAQIIVALLLVDFLQWCVHNLLHRVPFLWPLHKVHHSVVDGEMDWIVSFRFQWTEVIVYRSLLYLPLAYFGFGYEAVMFHAIFGTLIGHLNHANLNISWGPLRYVLNSPRMHIWHHDYNGDAKTTVNFGIIFSMWDWIFGTAKVPDEPPEHLGFAGVETFPNTFFAQMAWPLPDKTPLLLSSAFGMLLIAGGWWGALPPAYGSAQGSTQGSGQGAETGGQTPMLGEVAASSQPAHSGDFVYAKNPQEASVALQQFGRAAKAAGFLRPESMVSADELAAALGAPDLVLLDVRPKARFERGHIPSAQRLGRGDYSSNDRVPGLSRNAAALELRLRERGVKDGDTLVLYSDGGPEPYRLWWTLKHISGLNTRVLDGGLAEYKALGHGIAEGRPLHVMSSSILLSEKHAPADGLWNTMASYAAESTILDTRSEAEFSGEKQHRKAARAGHMPKATHLEWTQVFVDEAHPVLKKPADLATLFLDHGVEPGKKVLTMCQSGTRSSAVYFALWQLGRDDDLLQNYDGSWAEYSRLEPISDESNSDASR